MKYTVLIACILCSLTVFAQPKEVQIELSETFAQYQNAFNNATAAYNMLEKGYKKSSNVVDARYYLGSASKYAKTASEYCSKASGSAEKTLAIPVVASCKGGTSKYSKMNSAYVIAAEKFTLAQTELDQAMEIEDFDQIAQKMAGAITYLQSGVQQLNLSVEEMNAGSKAMSGCK